MTKSLALIMAFFLCTGFLAADLSVNGYVKSFIMMMLGPESAFGLPSQSHTSMWAWLNRFRLNTSLRANSWSTFVASYSVSPQLQDRFLFNQPVSIWNTDSSMYRLGDFNSLLFPDDVPDSNFGVFHNLDRLYVKIQSPLFDLYIGRQPIAWGSARLVNPTDIIAPYLFNELDPEERRGVDAVRLRIPIGEMDELDLGFVAGEDLEWEKCSFFARGQWHLWNMDVSLLFLNFYQNIMVGLDLTRSIGGAGFWLEGAYVWMKEGCSCGSTGNDGYFRLSTGLDYRFKGNIYVFGEYHFNGTGLQQQGYDPGEFNRGAYTEGAVYLMGQHYLNTGCTLEVTPLMPATMMFIVNLTDGSLIFAPSIEYNVSENIYLAAGAFVGFGKEPAVPLYFRSEFGSYPDMIFSSFRYYF